MPRTRLALVLVALAGCGELTEVPATISDTASAGESSGEPSSDGTTAGTDPATTTTTATTDDPTTAGPTTDPPATSSTTATTTSSTTATTGPDDTTGDATTDVPETTGPDDTTGGQQIAPDLPAPTADCPEIIDGTIPFHPAGLDSARDVRIWFDPDTADQLDGPVVFYWHGTGGQPSEAQTGLGELGIQEILDAGGIVVAPTHDPMAGVFPWFLVLGEQQDDLLLADEVLACASEQIGVDASRIYTLGFSAGGLHTAQMSIRRSNYIAAAVPYSGGLIFGAMPPFEDPDNKFAAMIMHGGQSDVVVVGFEQASKDYQAYLQPNDNFSFICNHGGGHSIPDAQDSVMQFLMDHPYGVGPSPYTQDLPQGFPPYCAL
jgi:predicted esterase